MICNAKIKYAVDHGNIISFFLDSDLSNPSSPSNNVVVSGLEKEGTSDSELTLVERNTDIPPVMTASASATNSDPLHVENPSTTQSSPSTIVYNTDKCSNRAIDSEMLQFYKDLIRVRRSTFFEVYKCFLYIINDRHVSYRDHSTQDLVHSGY